VRACPFLPAPAGNIVDTPLRDIVGRLRGGDAPAGCKDDLHFFAEAVERLRRKP
jgi:hypothetical protein